MSTIGELASFLACETAATSGRHPAEQAPQGPSNGKPVAAGVTLVDTP